MAGKPLAKDFAQQGDRYIGTPYTIMDCQKLYEQMLKDVGINKDLKGSNAWYRAMDWVGTPKECLEKFGLIPEGATLFIWADDGGEVARGYHDGKGNASHIGVFIARREGAIHSSATKRQVCYSNFKGKAIKGGWNRVGLTRLLSYGEKVDQMIGTPTDIPVPQNVVQAAAQALAQTVQPTAQTAQGTARKRVTGGRLNVRVQPGGSIITQLADGEEVEIIADHGEWAEVAYKRRGYVMTKYLSEV